MQARALIPIAALACLIVSTTVEAVPTYYFNDPLASRAAFQAATSAPLVLESFEDAFPGGISASFPVGGPQTFTVSSSGDSIGRSSFARGVTDGSFAMTVDEDPPGLTLTFAFNNPINAFGLDVNDLNFVTMSFADNLGNTTADVLVGDNGGPVGGPDFQNLQFFGVINTDPFSTVQLTFTNPSASTGTIFLDRLEYAQSAAVPEPLTLALIGLGAPSLTLYLVGRRQARCRRRFAPVG